jgi:hypothetical protein
MSTECIITHGAASVPVHPAPSPGKHIEYDPITGDWAAYYNGQLLGYRKRQDQAQTLADQFVYDLLRHGGAVTADVETPDVASLPAGAE